MKAEKIIKFRFNLFSLGNIQTHTHKTQNEMIQGQKYRSHFIRNVNIKY